MLTSPLASTGMANRLDNSQNADIRTRGFIGLDIKGSGNLDLGISNMATISEHLLNDNYSYLQCKAMLSKDIV
jgi:hypothetical protein